MNPLDRYGVPESDFSDAEIDAARERLVADLVDDGWTRGEAEGRIDLDDEAVYEQCEADRQGRDADRADDLRDQRKAGM